MDPAYREYYRTVLQAASRWPGLFPRSLRPAHFQEARRVLGVVEDVGNVVRMETGRRLREDAQLFMYLNAWQMVLRPVLEVRRAEPDSILADIQGDLTDIALSAGAETDVRDVSGHQVIDAVSGRWPSLRLTNWEIWE